jgi:assimilatory nitrate reductase catalytic subunit
VGHGIRQRQGWQLQVAQTGERSSVLAWHEGQLMLGLGKEPRYRRWRRRLLKPLFAPRPCWPNAMRS